MSHFGDLFKTSLEKVPVGDGKNIIYYIIPQYLGDVKISEMSMKL